MLQDIDYEDEQAMLHAKEELLIKEKVLGIKAPELIRMLDDKMTSYDIKMRTVADIVSTYARDKKEKAIIKDGKEILYKTREEAKTIKEKINDIISIYNMISFEDELSIKSAKGKIDDIFTKYGVGESLVLELNDRLNVIDEEYRTVLGECYATREEADLERKKVAGNIKYSTEVEAAIVRNELEKIENIKRTNNSSNTLLGSVRALKELRTLRFEKEQSKEIIIREESEIIDAYNRKRKRVKEIPTILIRLILFSVISFGICIYAIPKIFAGKLLMKGLAVFIVLWVLGVIMEMCEELKKHVEIKKEICEVDRIISIKDSKIIYK